MDYAPDLSAYFVRVGYGATAAPTLACLNAIVRAHVESIPFENLDVLLGRPIDLDPAAVEDKLVHRGRGGYCFEQNSLLAHMLTAMGFTVTPLSARVRLGRERSMTPPRTHMCLRVDLEGERWLVDVGVGALSLTSALRLDTDAVQPTPHEPRRLVRDGAWQGQDLRGPQARVFHQVNLGNGWEDVCDMTLEPMPQIDQELGNWYTSAHPRSHFRNRLMAARATPEGRISLLNRTLKVRAADGKSKAQTVQSPSELLKVLHTHFGLEFSAEVRFPCDGLDWSTQD
ncbi:MAG: arylamine N-acetyltransferase [Nannocystaceae bacterium]|nr:arylamine N-acetyltransferase [Nannocystaceae bacterium]